MLKIIGVFSFHDVMAHYFGEAIENEVKKLTELVKTFEILEVDKDINQINQWYMSHSDWENYVDPPVAVAIVRGITALNEMKRIKKQGVNAFVVMLEDHTQFKSSLTPEFKKEIDMYLDITRDEVEKEAKKLVKKLFEGVNFK